MLEAWEFAYRGDRLKADIDEVLDKLQKETSLAILDCQVITVIDSDYMLRGVAVMMLIV